MPGGGISRPAREATPPSTPYNIGDFCIDEYRPVKVIVIGAGFSGITAGIRCVVPNVPPKSPVHTNFHDVLQIPSEDTQC